MKAQIWSKSYWLTTQWDHNEWIIDMLIDSGFQIIDQTEHHFKPIGYTLLILLAESHLAVHTFPEEGKVYIQISSCNKQKYKKFDRLMRSFGSTYAEVKHG
jgi:S-adenosylmethionine/arginine decarboxylase-like enzyme